MLCRRHYIYGIFCYSSQDRQIPKETAIEKEGTAKMPTLKKSLLAVPWSMAEMVRADDENSVAWQLTLGTGVPPRLWNLFVNFTL